MVDWVGGKNANLGELSNKAQIPVPHGFAITTLAYDFFLDYNGLRDEVERVKMDLDPSDPNTISTVSEDAQRLIVSAVVPDELAEPLNEAYVEMAERSCAETGRPGVMRRVALRSSAIGEDSELSNAGQYLSVLNVSGDQIAESYKRIVASLYSARAISYRLSKGNRAEEIAMSVACVEMVESVASGVTYSQDPSRVWEDRILISSVWGLGPCAVDGVVAPDTYVVTKNGELEVIETTISDKTVQLTSDPAGGVREIPVERNLHSALCLSYEQVRTLANYALRIEKRYGCP